MDASASALDLAFHPYLRLQAEGGRGLPPNPGPKPIRRGSFHAINDARTAITRGLAEHKAGPRSFLWKASAGSIPAKPGGANATSD